MLVVAINVIALDSPGQKEWELGDKLNCAFVSDSKKTFRITNKKERAADLRIDTVIKRCVLFEKEGDAAGADASLLCVWL